MKKYAALLLVFATFLLYVSSCKKSDVKPETLPVAPPPEPFVVTVNTATFSSITESAATFGGQVVTSGPGSISERGVCWNTAAAPTVQNNKITSGSGAGNFSGSVTALAAATPYFARAYAIDDKGVVYYGNEVNFTTSAAAVISVVTNPATEIKDKSVMVSASFVLPNPNEILKEKGIAFGQTPDPLITGAKIIAQTSGNTTFSSKHETLTVSTKYYARAYVITAANNVIYGNQIEFTTLAIATNPPAGNSSLTVTTINVSSITTTGANTGGSVAIVGLETVAAKGVCYHTSANPTISNQKISNGAGDGGFQSILTGLTASTKYYVRAYATNAKGETTYGNQVEFNTAAAPTVPQNNSLTVVTGAISEITATTANAVGTVTVTGLETAASRGLCWATTTNPTINSLKTTSGAGQGTFQGAMTGLTPATVYYVRAYATNASGVATYGNQVTFTSAVQPPAGSAIQVTTGQADVLSNSRVKIAGSFTNPGNETISQKGIQIGTTTGFTDGAIYLSFSTGNTIEVDVIGALTPNKVYYARAVVTNSLGIKALGNVISFNLSSEVPATINVSYDSFKITSTGAQAYLQVALESGSTARFSAIGVCYHTSANPTISNSILKHASNEPGGKALDLSGLTPSTTYYSKGYVTTTDGKTFYSPEVSFKTSDPGTFTVTTQIHGREALYIVPKGIIETKDNTLVFSARGFYWGTTNTPSTNGTKINVGTGAGEFTYDIKNLTPSTDYYVQAFGTTSTGKTVLGQVVLMRTTALPVEPPPVTNPPTNPTDPTNPTNPTDPTNPGNPTTGGPDDIIITLVAFNKATNDCPEGSGLFNDAKGYIYKVIDKKNLDAERIAADTRLKSQYGAGTTVTYKSTAFTTLRYAVAIQYNKKHAGWDCRTIVIAFAFGKTKAEALTNAINDKISNAGNVPHTVLKEINW